jgi:hypothetical protein
MSVIFPDRISHKRLLDSRLVSVGDQPYGRLRLEEQTPNLNQGQTAYDLSLRRAAEMENGRARNIYTIV